MRQIAKVTLALGLAEVIAVGMRVVNTKYVAVFLGPSGVGVFNQIISLYSWLVLLTALGVENGLTKYVSEYNALGDHDKIIRITFTALVCLTACSAAICTVVFFCAQNISVFLLDSAKYSGLVCIMAFALPQTVLAFVPMGVIKGYRKIKELAIYKVIDGVLNVSILLPLVYLFAIQGAVFNLVLLSTAQLLLVVYFYYKYVPDRISLKELSLSLFQLKSVINVFTYGIVNLTITLVNLLMVTILFRRLIITRLGIEQNGIYSPAYGLSCQSLLLIVTTITVYSFTRISEARDNKEINLEVNQLIRISLLVMVPILFMLTCYRKYAILLLYTDEFLPVTEIMPIHFMGDYFKILALAIALPLHAKADFKAMLFFNITMSVLIYPAGYFLIPRYGLYGAGTAYFFMFFAYFLMVVPYVRRKFDFRLLKENAVLAALSFMLILAAPFLQMPVPYLVPTTIALLAGWLWFILTKEEKRYLNNKINAILTKR